MAEAEKFGLMPVIEPATHTTLQTALHAALHGSGGTRAVAA
jgi:hypothetical protein